MPRVLLPRQSIAQQLPNWRTLDFGGGFGCAMSSHFLHRPRLAGVLIDAKGDRVIRQPTKETGFLAESGL